MRIRSVILVKTNNRIEQFQLPEEDIEQYLTHLKDMDSPDLVVIDGSVARVGMFESSCVQAALKRIKSL